VLLQLGVNPVLTGAIFSLSLSLSSCIVQPQPEPPAAPGDDVADLGDGDADADADRDEDGDTAPDAGAAPEGASFDSQEAPSAGFSAPAGGTDAWEGVDFLPEDYHLDHVSPDADAGP